MGRQVQGHDAARVFGCPVALVGSEIVIETMTSGGNTMAVQPVPAGYHTVTPYLIVRHAANAIDFYK